MDISKVELLVKTENKFVENLNKKFDFIFSDGRYGVYSKKIPSYILSHQVSFIVPKWFQYLKNLIDYRNYKYLSKFKAVFIPDFEDEEKSLAWKLSHTYILKKLNHNYIWPISSYNENKKISKDIDYYFIISWYLQEHKESFINKLIEQSKKLEWKKVFVLGDTSTNSIKKIKEYDITLYSNVTSNTRIDLFNRSKIIISRSWYTTVMDLYINNKKAVLFPTPNQTEQEYLAKYLDNKWLFINGWEQDFDLINLINKIK